MMSESVSNYDLHGRTVGSDAAATRTESGSTTWETFADDRNREIGLALVDGVEGAELDGLTAMYTDIDRRHRAQGLPPVGAADVREWLTGLPGLHLVARHDERTVGHAAVVPDESGGHELVIFVHQSYHDTGIGTHLLRTLLAQASVADVESVWLTVERTNRPAVALYEKMGFEIEERRRASATLKMRHDLEEQ